LKELVGYLKDTPLFFDTETAGLYGEIMLAQFFQEDWQEVLLVKRPDIEELAALLQDRHLVIHNASYDISTIQANLGRYWAPELFDDTFLLSKLHYYEHAKFSLDAVFTYALGTDPYDDQDLDKKVLQKSKWNKELTHDQLIYAATDVYYMPQVWQQVLDMREDYNYRLDILTLKYCLDFQNNGMPVDMKLLKEKENANKARIDEIALPINANSYKQVREYIDSDQSDALGLTMLALNGNTRAAAVQETRKLVKQNSFLTKFTTSDSRIYGKFLPSTRSGRLASKDQNLQQIPRNLKGVFGYTEKDNKVLVYSDYAQLELRCICTIANEQRMEKLFCDGEDLHEYTAKMLFGEDFTKTQRQVAKTANFGLLYGAGTNVFGQILLKLAGLQLTEAELAKVKTQWRGLWTSIARWQDKGISDWRNGLPSATPLGRRYTANMLTDQLNIQNQGFGAECAKLALHYMMPKLPKGVKMLNFIHDSYILECNNDEQVYKSVCTLLADSMKKAWFESISCTAIPDLPMPVECFVGLNWGTIEDDYIYKYELRGEKDV